MFTSISSRLWLTYMLLVAAILGVVTLALLLFLVRNPRLARETQSNLILAANAIQRQRIAINENADAASLQNAAQRADELLNVRVALFGPDGNLLADSREESEAAIPSEASQTRQLRPAEIAEFSDTNNKVWLYTTRTMPGRYLLMVASPRPTAPVISLFADEFFPPIIRAGLIALILSLVLSLLMTRWITSPLQRVSAAAKDFADGRMRQVRPEGPRELKSLARTFNEMSHKVQTSQQSQRDFVANISHELRTPLTSIQGFAQAILDGTAHSGASLKQAAQVIYDEAGRMHRLVLDLLELARLDAGNVQLERQPVDLEKLLRGVSEKFQPQAQAAKVDQVVEVEKVPSFLGDHDRLVQVFTNLVDNALQHSARGGRVVLRTQVQDGFIEVFVADNGPGISPEETKRIFERFYQVDKARSSNAGRGAGLGLPIAEQIVHAHGGTLQVQSQLGRGSTFIVRLPIERTSKHSE